MELGIWLYIYIERERDDLMSCLLEIEEKSVWMGGRKAEGGHVLVLRVPRLCRGFCWVGVKIITIVAQAVVLRLEGI